VITGSEGLSLGDMSWPAIKLAEWLLGDPPAPAFPSPTQILVFTASLCLVLLYQWLAALQNLAFACMALPGSPEAWTFGKNRAAGNTIDSSVVFIAYVYCLNAYVRHIAGPDLAAPDLSVSLTCVPWTILILGTAARVLLGRAAGDAAKA
jgi:hypothetical protein